MSKISNFDDYHNVAICGVGYQAETIAKYMKMNSHNCIILVKHFTQRPEDCYRIPSKRTSIRNSFSEVDLLMDTVMDNVPVKRFDMLSEEEKEKFVFLYFSDEESEGLFNDIKERIGDNYYYISRSELETLNKLVWDDNAIISELWNINKFLYSEISILKNALRRQLKATVFDFHFEFHLVEHCNLKCAGCTHFAPLAQEEYLSVNEFEKDIMRLSDLTGGNTRFINLLGGEPLLHPDISKFFRICRAAFPNTLIRVVTNGILLNDMPEEFWKECKDNSIIIGITQYPIDVDYDSVINTIKQKGIGYESFSGDGYPRDEMWRLALDASETNRPVENFINCPRANACIFVSHGKLFNCATMANIYHFNQCFGTKFELRKEDYIDIYEVKSAEDMLEKLCNPKPFCRFCNIEKRRYGIKWSNSMYSSDEWT